MPGGEVFIFGMVPTSDSSKCKEFQFSEVNENINLFPRQTSKLSKHEAEVGCKFRK